MTSQPASPSGCVLLRLAPWLLRGVAFAWWAYLWAVFVYRERLAGIHFGAVMAGSVFLVVAGALILAPVGRFASPARLLEVGLAGLTTLTVIFVADLVLTMRDNVRGADTFCAAQRIRASAGSAHVAWRAVSRIYYPSDGNFFLYKPNAVVAADIYGQYYSPDMRRSRTLVDSVFQLRRVTYGLASTGCVSRIPWPAPGFLRSVIRSPWLRNRGGKDLAASTRGDVGRRRVQSRPVQHGPTSPDGTAPVPVEGSKRLHAHRSAPLDGF